MFAGFYIIICLAYPRLQMFSVSKIKLKHGIYNWVPCTCLFEDFNGLLYFIFYLP